MEVHIMKKLNSDKKRSHIASMRTTKLIKAKIFTIIFLWMMLNPLITGLAQKLDLNEYRLKYPGESKVLLNERNDIDINMVADRLQIEMKKHEETLCINKNVFNQWDQGVNTSGFFKITALSAKTLIPGKFGYKTVYVDKFDTSDFSRSATFFDDVKSINFTFPKVEEGARTVLDYTYHISDPRYLNAFYFSNYIPVESSELNLSCPTNVKIAYNLINCDSLKIDFSQKQVGNRIIYQWKVNHVPKLNIEESAPAVPYYAAHMFVHVTEYTVNGINIKVLSDISDLYAWYHNMVSQINKETSPSLKLLVDSITRNDKSELEKVKSIYYWVQDHIKYIAFEAGRGGFVPRDADVVFTKRYGDCKDMTSLINKMLEIAGIESSLTWIGTRHLPYRYHDLPLPAVDNHMIVTYKYKNQIYYLDATPGPHPFNYPSYGIQGKEALVDLKNNFEIEKVPEIAPELNLQADTVKIKLEGKKLVGSGISYFRGYSRVDMYNHIVQKDKKDLTTFLKNYFQKGNNKFLIDDIEVKNLDQRDQDLIISYNFNLSDYATIIGNEVFLNMNMDKIEAGDGIKDTKKTDLEIKYKKLTINHVIFEMPKDYKLTFIPNNSEYQNDLFGYHITYTTGQNNKVLLTQKFYTNFLLLQHQQFPQWNSMLESLQNAYKTSINLKKDREP